MIGRFKWDSSSCCECNSALLASESSVRNCPLYSQQEYGGAIQNGEEKGLSSEGTIWRGNSNGSCPSCYLLSLLVASLGY